MGMNRNIVYQVGQQFRRTNDIEIRQEDKDAIVRISIGHLAVGNVNEFMLGMTSLAKLQTTADLSQKLDQMSAVLNGIVQPEGSHAITPTNVVEDGTSV
tara:strand:+ start:135 stop:431 length:297 start_codon:yes stop_codon:yes gene_type:complete